MNVGVLGVRNNHFCKQLYKVYSFFKQNHVVLSYLGMTNIASEVNACIFFKTTLHMNVESI